MGCLSDESESNDDPTSVSAVLALFLVLVSRIGLNDSCLISSSTRKLASSPPPRVLRLIILLSGEQSAMSARDEGMVPELQDTLRGFSASLVGADLVLMLLSELPKSRDDIPLKDEDRRCVLGDEVGDE